MKYLLNKNIVYGFYGDKILKGPLSSKQYTLPLPLRVHQPIPN